MIERDIIQTPSSFSTYLIKENILPNYFSSFMHSYLNEHDVSNYVTHKLIDKEKGIIKSTYSIINHELYEIQTEIITFSESFQSYISNSVEKSIELFESKFSEILSIGNSPIAFTNYHLGILKQNYPKAIETYRTSAYKPDLFKEVNEAVIIGIEDTIKGIEKVLALYQGNNIDSDLQSNSTTNKLCKDSFLWDFANEEEATSVLSQLFNLLTEEPSLIQSDKDAFINAFTQKEVPNGIRWMVKSKNKQYSKASLFYFITLLNEGGYLKGVPNNEINSKIKYVFRDGDGNQLKNIRQSKANTSKNPAEKVRIDAIISQLH